MTPKFFFLPALAVVVAFIVLAVNHQVSNAANCQGCDGGGCIVITGHPCPGDDDDGKGKGKPEPETCPANSTSIGKIHAAAEKTAPLYPMVIGQDDTKRGADISCSVTVDPSTRTTYSHNAAGKCVANVETFTETATSEAAISLDAASRDWILNGDLQTRYPGAYLHTPNMSLGACGSALNAQVADPGRFVITVSGETSGTPVQGPRSFSIDAGEFLAYLREIVITK